MTSTVNRVILVGTIDTVPTAVEERGAANSFTLILATRETIRKGDRAVEHVERHVVLLSEPLAKRNEAIMHRGSVVLVEGRLSTKSFLDSAGIKRFTTHVVATELAQFKQ